MECVVICGGMRGAFEPLKTCQFVELYFLGFPILGMVRRLRLEVGEAVAVAAHEGVEPEGVKIAGDETRWLGQRAEQPAEIEFVGPDGDVDLITGEEGDGCPDAVDCGTVVERTFEVEAEAFLRSAAEGDDNVLRAEAIETFEQRGVGDGTAPVDGGHVDVVFGDGDSLPFEPCEIAFRAGGAGHDPEGIA